MRAAVPCSTWCASPSSSLGWGLSTRTQAPERRAPRHQPGGRPHRAGSADHQHRVAGIRGALGGIERRQGQRLAEPDHAGPNQVAALGAARWLGGRRPFGVAGHGPRAPAQPAILQDVAVQADGAGVAGTLVQVVDVLADDGQPTRMASLEVGQRAVPRIRLRRANAEAALGVPGPDPCRVGHEAFLAGQLGRIETRPQARHRIAEGRDAALGAHARTGQQADRSRAAQALARRLERGGRHAAASRLCRRAS